MKDIWFIEASSLLKQQYPSGPTTNSCKSILKRRQAKVIYSEIFFLNQEAVDARYAYETTKENYQEVIEKIKDNIKLVKNIEAIKRPTIEADIKLDATIKNLAALRKENLQNQKILKQWGYRVSKC